MAATAVLLGLLFLGAPVRSQDPPPGSVEALTLEQAIALAAQANRQVTTAKLELGKAEEQIAAAKTHRFPVFSLSVLGSQRLVPITFEFSHATDQGGNPIADAGTSYTVDPEFMTFVKAQAAQPISQLYQIGLGIQQAEVSRDIAREQLRQETQAVADSVKTTFYQLLQIQSAMEAVQDEIKFYAEFERLLGEFVKQQTALPAELMDIQARLAQSRFDADKLADNLATQKEALNDLMGRDIRTEFRVDPIPEPAPMEAELGPARARALEQRPEIREARMRVQLAELDRRIKKADYIPQVYVSMDYSSTLNLEFLPRNMWSLGVLLQWDIYDWGRKKHELGQKMMAEKQATEAAGRGRQVPQAPPSAGPGGRLPPGGGGGPGKIAEHPRQLHPAVRPAQGRAAGAVGAVRRRAPVPPGRAGHLDRQVRFREGDGGGLT
jgi:outer membrane protein